MFSKQSTGFLLNMILLRSATSQNLSIFLVGFPNFTFILAFVTVLGKHNNI